MNRIFIDQIKDLESKIEDLKRESIIKGKYMTQMSNTIVALIEEQEEKEENERDLESVVTRYHLNLI
jgi:macrodomain Ter protein organizer (MatP/YcbG family)